MRIFFATLLALLMLVQSFNQTMLVVNYELQQARITAEFCVNKQKPALHCNGKCHLAKELKKAEQADKKLPTPVKEKFEVLQFCAALPAFLFPISTVSAPDFQPFIAGKYSPPDFGFFQPPRFLV